MNALVNPLSGLFQPTDQFCSEHHEQMISMSGHIFCKSCCNEILNRSKAGNENRLTEELIKKRVDGAFIPLRHSQSLLKNYQVVHEGQQFAKKTCEKFIQDFKAGEKRNLVMVGRTGTGKTHLGSAITNNMITYAGRSARYITSSDLTRKIMQSWYASEDNEESAIYRFTEYDLLVIDEYGLHDRNDKNPAVLDLVHKVLYARYDAMKPTVLISNFMLPRLQEDLGARLWSRFQQGGCDLIECNWDDARMGGAA